MTSIDYKFSILQCFDHNKNTLINNLSHNVKGNRILCWVCDMFVFRIIKYDIIGTNGRI